MKKFDIYEMVTDLIIERLEKSVVPWGIIQIERDKKNDDWAMKTKIKIRAPVNSWWRYRHQELNKVGE